MKKTNFKIDAGYALEVQEFHWDLHSNFDFTGFTYCPKNNQLLLKWEKTKGDWVPKESPAKVNLKFENVSLWRLSYFPIQNKESQAEVRKTLSFIGYLHPDDVEVMDGYLEEKEANETYHMIIYFENDFAIKVFSESASCTIF